MKRCLSLSHSQKRSYTAALGYANSSGRLEEAYKGQPSTIETLSTLLGLPTWQLLTKVKSCSTCLTIQKMISVVDPLTPSHPSFCNIVLCPDLLWGKGSGDYWVLSCFWLCQVCSLNSEQANKIVVHQIKVAFLAQPRKHSILTRPFSTRKHNTHASFMKL